MKSRHPVERSMPDSGNHHVGARTDWARRFGLDYDTDVSLRGLEVCRSMPSMRLNWYGGEG